MSVTVAVDAPAATGSPSLEGAEHAVLPDEASEAVRADSPFLDDDEGGGGEDELDADDSPVRGRFPGADSTPMGRRLSSAAADRLPPTVRAAMWSLDGRSVVVLLAVGAAAVVAALLAFGGSPRTEAVVAPTFEPAATVPASGAAPTSGGTATTSAAFVVVDVAGLVARPGVYELPPGSRVVDAVDAAGGAIEGTDLSQLNLARVVSDGEQIAVGVPAAPAVTGGQATGSSETGASGPLDLNTATEAELDGLPGVGPVLAGRIIAWRDENGQFSSVEELMEVSGIGTATFADLEPLVRV